MLVQNASVTYRCGFGGCSAPEAPVPVSAPSRAPSASAPSRPCVRRRDGNLIEANFGFGGCRAPEAPVPVFLPSANSSFGAGQALAA